MRQSSPLGVALWLVASCREPAASTRVPPSQPEQQPATTSATDASAGSADVAIAGETIVPGGNAPVEGPTGTIEGIVRIEGPLPAPTAIELPAAFASKRGCTDAARRYAQPFDVSTPGPIAGALVSAEARAPGLGTPLTRRLTVRDCDIAQRYLFAKENDLIELESIAQAPHLPVVVGTGESINQLLIPGQNPRRLVFASPGQYPITFRDLPPFVGAMIYRLRQRFIDTTDVQGHYRITDVPVGSVIVHAWIPGAVESRATAVVTAGQTTQLDFRLTPAPVPRPPVQGIRHNDGTVRTPTGQIIPQ